ncbi:SusF/SusE family outer membrane protein [Salinimicrobium oceani]|uniref:SusF/SusE family outer membrane protein n=1 Tax=Salinimicrobium oceani TaxID=2722702 RepID=A0ABX1CWG7_9FLAO|nr:SusF/SusE family outer membrane protein [Salinimicrobium oceani]NJW51324.1 SusF/SusE family outer membrane protein [Salinimicrobium oceani]
MKKISILILALVALTGFNACTSDDDVVFIAQPDPEGISFVNTFSSTYILTSATAENTAERFVWNEIELDVPTNIVYEVQGSTTSDFSDFTIFGTTSGNNLAIKVSQLMDLAEDAGLDNDPATEAPNTGTIFVRVVASAGTAGELAHTSEVQAITVVLPEQTGEEEIDLREFYLVGNATPDNWNNNANNLPLFRDPTNPNLYHFTGKFLAGEFKLLEVRGQWQPQWGLDNGTLTSSDILGGDPGAFTVATEGYYTLTVNAEEMTYSFEPYDASGAATYTTIGILGSGTQGLHNTGADGWASDVDMTQSAFNPHLWYITGMELKDGEIKFRAGDAWDVNWGGDTPLSGKATLGGPNIPVEEGTYEIWLNDLTGRYILIPPSADE